MRKTLIVLVLVISTVTALRGRYQQMMGILGQTGQGSPTLPANCGNLGVHCAANCSQSAVAQQIGLAAEGDTVVLPVCTNTDVNNTSQGNVWTQGVTITTAINFIGQGMDQTVIIANLPAGSASPVITFNNGNVDTTGFRISGLTLQEETNVITTGGVAMIDITTGSHALRVDHIYFKNLGTHGQSPGPWGIGIGDSEWGVVDHVQWVGGSAAGNARTSHLRWGNTADSSIGYGDRSWSDPSTYGTNQAIYFEDDWDLLSGSNSKSYACNVSARCVWRHNWLTQLGSHGTDSGGRNRSVRQWEVYQNKFNCNAVTGTPQTIIFRGGTGFVWGNDTILPGTTLTLPNGDTVTTPISQCYADNFQPGSAQVQVYRTFGNYAPWGSLNNSSGVFTGNGGCDGTGPYDNNDPHGLYDSGTIGTGGTTTLLNDTTKNWTANQWTGYMVRSLQSNGTFAKIARIESNTSNALTTDSQSSQTAWAAGQVYEIRRVYDCMDTQGRGQSAYLYGGTPTTGICQPPSTSNVGCVGGGVTGFVNNKVEPTYVWSNRKFLRDGSVLQYYNPAVSPGWSYFPTTGANTSPNSPLAMNRDWYEETAPGTFNGTFGMAVGPVSSRPTTCTPNSRHNPDGSVGPGVGWWDSSTSQLTVCTAPNVWSLYYTPYVYPHPLVTASTLSRNGQLIETGDGHLSLSLVRKSLPLVQKAKAK